MKFYMWSGLHFAFLASPVVFAVITYFIFRKTSDKTKRIAGIIFSVIAVLFLVARNPEIYIENGHIIEPEIIPFQICHFANFVLLFAFIFNSKSMFGFAFCFNLPMAFLSILFADSLEGYTTILTARGMAYIFGHMLIVGISIYALIFGFVRLDRKTLIRTMVICMGLFVSSIFINNLFNLWMSGTPYTANYFYSLRPEDGTPLEWFYNWGQNINLGFFQFNPVYLLCSGILGIVVILAMYGIYRLTLLSSHRANISDSATTSN